MSQEVIDCHQHYFDPANNDFQSFLRSLGVPCYLPEQYIVDSESQLISRTVHVEAMPDNGVKEILWIEKMVAEGRCKVAAIVAMCDLSLPSASQHLESLLQASPDRLRGIRYILDYNGPFDSVGTNGTHIACSRHGKDYLRDPVASAAFARGFSLLAEHHLSFDLQCAPVQLPAAAALLKSHPSVRVCLNHMGKPRALSSPSDDSSNSQQGVQWHSVSCSATQRLSEWRRGMRLMASLPQVYVKFSLLGYVVPGWHEDVTKENFLKELVLEVIDLFGADRCMFGSNQHVSDAVSDSDGTHPRGPSMEERYRCFRAWVHDLSQREREWIFCDTARHFYRI